jgi:hypothetical protein
MEMVNNILLVIHITSLLNTNKFKNPVKISLGKRSPFIIANKDIKIKTVGVNSSLKSKKIIRGMKMLIVA